MTPTPIYRIAEHEPMFPCHIKIPDAHPEGVEWYPCTGLIHLANLERQIGKATEWSPGLTAPEPSEQVGEEVAVPERIELAHTSTKTHNVTTSYKVAYAELSDKYRQLEAELAEAKARLDYVHRIGLRFGMMKSSDKPEPYLMHTWTEDSDHERMFREWTHSIGWEDTVEKLTAERDGLLREVNDCMATIESMADSHKKVMARLVGDSDGLRKEVKNLTEVDFKNAAIIDKLQEERDFAQGEVIIKGAACASMREQCNSLRTQLLAAKEEIEALRIWGNKDCTAMADEALRAERAARTHQPKQP